MQYGTIDKTDGNQITASVSHTAFFTRDMTLASGTQAITGVGFQPKSVVFFTYGQGRPEEYSWGLTDENGDEIGMHNESNSAAGQVGGMSSIAVMTQSVGVSYVGALQSYDTDGFTISWTRNGAAAGALTVTYIAFK